MLKGIVALKHTLVIVKTNLKRNALLCVCSVCCCVCRYICFSVCISLCECAVGRGWRILSAVFPQLSSTLLFVCFILFSFCLLSLDRFLTVLELAKKTRQTGQQPSGIYLLFSSTFLVMSYSCSLPHTVILNHVLGVQKHVFITARQTLY